MATHLTDWLITIRDVDVEELCVVYKLISHHFVISFALRFRKPGKTTKEVRSRNVRALNTENFKTDVLSAFPAVSGAADAVSVLTMHVSMNFRTSMCRLSCGR